MTNPEDLTSVIEGAQRLEQPALEQLVDLYSGRLYGFLYRFTNQRGDAEDLVQEVFVRVVRSIENYEHDGRFEGWLFRIAANLARDRIRHVQRSPHIGSLDSTGTDDAEPPRGAARQSDPVGPRPDRAMELAEDVDRLQVALSELSEPEREVILLRHYSEMSFSEVAETMGTPLGTALARSHRGLTKLRELLESQS
ncbi:MAG: sigma-70 family RNA polymerase sigma factor [Phycisphaerales bacterium]|nr:MAG: sigma-70 family RNA polymerase sigma factor [Phycisphaerales bacterium]